MAILTIIIYIYLINFSNFHRILISISFILNHLHYNLHSFLQSYSINVYLCQILL